MFRIQKILFPIEFSAREEAAATFVLSLAQRYHARVVAFHAFQPPPPIYAGMSAIYPESYDFTGAIDEMRIQLRKFADAQLPKVDVECIVDTGEAGNAIAEYAGEQGVDLIAMPTHGYGTFRRALLGSVTAKVLHDSALPVWTSAHAPEPSHRAHPQPRRILCSLDMKPESQHTLQVAIKLANDAGARVDLVTVPAETVAPDAAQRYLDELLARTVDGGCVDVQEEGETAVIERAEGAGNVAATVRNLALQKRADLVVIGRGSIRTGLGQLFANTYDIIRESPCPVLSV